MPGLSDLKPYQLWTARKVYKNPYLFIWLRMGLGKTVSTLTALRKLLNEFMVRKVLVIAPLRVASETWPEELEKWDHLKALSYTVITGNQEQRLDALSKDVEIYIINRENVVWLWKTLGKRRWFFDMVVYDESSRLKGGSKRTAKTKKGGGRRLSEFGALCNARRQFLKRIVLLTGTPAPKGLIDLWGQTYVLDLGERLGDSKESYEHRYFESDYMGYKLTPREGAKAKIIDRISDITVTLRASDHINLPENIFSPRYVNLPLKVMQQYREFEKKMVSKAHDVEAVNRGVLAGKLLQFCNGALYRNLENGDREVVHVHNEKLHELESIVNELQGENILLAYSYKFDLTQIKKKFPKAVIFDDEPDAVKLWNARKIGMLLAHPASMSHGLNMQFGGNTIVWYGMTNNGEYWDQLNCRLARPGQEKDHVYIHPILARGTADVRAYESTHDKGDEQDSIVEAILTLDS